jgi:hypothetical protein
MPPVVFRRFPTRLRVFGYFFCFEKKYPHITTSLPTPGLRRKLSDAFLRAIAEPGKYADGGGAVDWPLGTTEQKTIAARNKDGDVYLAVALNESPYQQAIQ